MSAHALLPNRLQGRHQEIRVLSLPRRGEEVPLLATVLLLRSALAFLSGLLHTVVKASLYVGSQEFVWGY